MRFMPTKTPEQQSCLMLHLTRHLFIRQQTAIINSIRAGREKIPCRPGAVHTRPIPRPALDVADIFRDHGPASRHAKRGASTSST